MVAVRRQPAGKERTESASVKAARSPSSIMCWVPILVAFSRPERIHLRTVSGSRLDRRAACGTVNIVARYYNKSESHVSLNEKPKYVASTTLTQARWANTTMLSGDVGAAIGELKAKSGRDLQVQGS